MNILTHHEIIHRMLKHADRILDWCNDNTVDSLAENPIYFDGCICNIWQIGQLAKRPTEAFMAQNCHIPWKKLNEYGNALYDGFPAVDKSQVFQFVRHDLPPLRDQLAALLKELTTTKG